MRERNPERERNNGSCWWEMYQKWSGQALDLRVDQFTCWTRAKNPPNLSSNSAIYEGRIMTTVAVAGNRQKGSCYLPICTAFTVVKTFNCRAWASWAGASRLLPGQETKMAQQEPGIQQAHMLALQGNFIYVNMSSACACMCVWLWVRESACERERKDFLLPWSPNAAGRNRCTVRRVEAKEGWNLPSG